MKEVIGHLEAAHYGTHVEAATYLGLWFVFCFSLGIAIVLRLLFGFARSNAKKTAFDELGAASLALFIVAAAGLIGHVVFVPIAADERWQPNFDVVTFGWALVLGLSFLVPIIQKFSAAGVSVEIREKAESITTSATDLLLIWSKQTIFWTDRKKSYDLPTDAIQWLSDVREGYIAERAFEATQWIGRDGERRRLSIWLLTVELSDALPRRQRVARFFYGAEFAADQPPFVYLDVDGNAMPSSGIIGYTALNQEPVNLAESKNHPKFIERLGAGVFSGLYLTPITRSKGTNLEKRIGVLSVDRQKAEKFETDQVNLFEAFAANLAVLMDPDA